MLGPALFKIRFPLFSIEEFSKKSVPFGVLSKDEVIAIYQFNSLPNYHGICDGILPMPFPTNGRISDRKKGTLLMNIEKVSEFAREEFESSRHSEKVYINGLPWKILAKIKKKWESIDNEKTLGIYLSCTVPKEDLNRRCCIRSATFQIFSQKNGPANSIGIICDRLFDNKQKKTKIGVPNVRQLFELSRKRTMCWIATKNLMTVFLTINVSNSFHLL